MPIAGIFQSSTIDAIAAYDSNFNQVFPNARPVRDEVIPRAKLMDHPLETGQIVTDYKITLPLEIMIQFIVTAQYYKDTYQQIWSLWQSSESLIIQTRVGSFGNMIIAEQPHEETPEKFDAIMLQLRFRQVLTPSQAQGFTPANPTQVNTQSIGQQSATPITVSPTGSSTGSSALNTQNNVQSDFGGATGTW